MFFYLVPFPMDMTNFIRQSQANGHIVNNTNHNCNNSNSNNGSIKVNKTVKPPNSNGININDIKRKASSLDSINAVERELDEVLKDLELNSQDLSEQLEENEYNMKNVNHTNSNNNNNNNNTVELPIIIQQKNLKLENSSSCSSANSCSSPSVSLNKSSNSNGFGDKTKSNVSKTNANQSEFLRNQSNPNNCELFIDDSDEAKSFEETNNNKNNSNKAINGARKRQNIISTYELCHDCFDNSLLTSNSSKAVNKNIHTCNESSNAKVASPVNGLNGNQFLHQPQPTTTTTTYNHMISPLKFSTSYSNQELSNSPNGHYFSNNSNANNNIYHSNGESVSLNHVYQNGNSNGGRSRSVLSQINESVIPENNYKPNSSLQFRNSKPNSNGIVSPNGNGNVISQRVIAIGMPNRSLSKDGDQSPSPRLIESKSNCLFNNFN